MSSDLLFDPQAVLRNRARAAANFAGHAYLFEAAADILTDRVHDIARQFEDIVEIGVGSDLLYSGLGPKLSAQHRYLSLDTCQTYLDALSAQRQGLRYDPERLPLAPQSCDLIVSNLVLHWVNDLPGVLAQIRAALKPDGVMIVTLFGGDTLANLHQAFLQADSMTSDTAWAHVSPRLELQQGAALLQACGFALPVADSQRFTVSHGSARALMHDLRGMGQGNALQKRRKSCLRRDTLAALEACYQTLAPAEGEAPGRVETHFDVICLTGWAPHTSQQQPLRPGSAKHSLADFLTS